MLIIIYGTVYPSLINITKRNFSRNNFNSNHCYRCAHVSPLDVQSPGAYSAIVNWNMPVYLIKKASWEIEMYRSLQKIHSIEVKKT